MTPIRRKITVDGINRVQYTLDPMGFILNSLALGDVIAAAPVIKYMSENYYVTPESYIVVAKSQFRPLFPFVPDSQWRNFESTDQPLWGIPSNWPLAMLNKKNDAKFVRNTPKNMHLSHYASITLADRILDYSDLFYVPLKPVNVDHFGVDFAKSVILITSYRDQPRSWPASSILELASWIKEAGFTPVFVGKTDSTIDPNKPHLQPKSTLPDDVSEHGVDLRNRTSLEELASIMAASRAVCGIDSGPIHLAGTTSTDIVCGYSTVSAKYRVPIRSSGTTYAITPRIECANCESAWRTSYWNFENCYFGHSNCCDDFTADKFIPYLTEIFGK